MATITKVAPTLADQEALYEQEIVALGEDGQKLQAFAQTVTTQAVRGFLNSGKNLVETEIAHRRKSIEIARAGYSEIHLPEGKTWTKGYVVDPRPRRSCIPIALKIAIPISLTLGIAAFLGCFFGTASINTLVTAALMTPLLSFGVAAVQGWLIFSAINEGALEGAGLRRWNDNYFLRVAPPPAVMEKYEQALSSGLFDRVMVTAPRKAFYQLTRVDPIIYAEAAGRIFEVAVYNVGEDLGLSS